MTAALVADRRRAGHLVDRRSRSPGSPRCAGSRPAQDRPLGEDARGIRSFVVQSSLATGVISLRTTLVPLIVGVVAGPTQVGLFRIAQAPQTGLAAASSPARLMLLTEQTRDWERGERARILAGVRSYSRWAAGVMLVAVPLFLVAMPWLVDIVFGKQYHGAVAAARIILLAAAVQFVIGWTKTLPVTIGRPRLRIVTHGLEAIVAIPLVAVLGGGVGRDGRCRRRARLDPRVRGRLAAVVLAGCATRCARPSAPAGLHCPS